MRRRSVSLVRRAAGVVVASLALVMVVAPPSPVLAGQDKEIVTGDKPTEAEDLARAQEPLVAAATAITALDPEREQLGGVRLQVNRAAVEVHWKGDVPEAVHKEIAVQEANGVRIVLRPADYSGSQLDAALHRIVDEIERYPGLVVIAPQPAASGLQGYFTDPEKAKEFDFPVPVGIEAAPEGAVPFTRNSDTPPFWGGAAAVASAARPAGRGAHRPT